MVWASLGESPGFILLNSVSVHVGVAEGIEFNSNGRKEEVSSSVNLWKGPHVEK